MVSSNTSRNLINKQYQGNEKMKQEVVRIFDDLDALLDYCRFNLVDYNPADLYNKGSKVWRDYEYSKRPRNFERKEWSNKPRGEFKPRGNSNYRGGRQ
jgi:hypothetical protein